MVGINSSKGGSFLDRILRKTTNEINKSFEKLTTGQIPPITAAAEAAIASALEAEGAQRSVANNNIANALSRAEIADSASSQLENILQRRQELAIQASNGTVSDEQRSALNAEYQALGQEANRIANTTTFNGENVFTTDATIQVGTGSGSDSQITLTANETPVASLNTSIGTAEDALASLELTEADRASLIDSRATSGAEFNRLQTALENNLSSSEAIAQAASRIRDVDVAEETANLVKNQIKQQAGVALQGQANLSAKTVLNLLA